MPALLLLLALGSPALAADAGACYTVADPDYRALCLARAHRDPGRCYAIRPPDLRALCRAEVRR